MELERERVGLPTTLVHSSLSWEFERESKRSLELQRERVRCSLELERDMVSSGRFKGKGRVKGGGRGKSGGGGKRQGGETRGVKCIRPKIHERVTVLMSHREMCCPCRGVSGLRPCRKKSVSSSDLDMLPARCAGPPAPALLRAAHRAAESGAGLPRAPRIVTLRHRLGAREAQTRAQTRHQQHEGRSRERHSCDSSIHPERRRAH